MNFRLLIIFTQIHPLVIPSNVLSIWSVCGIFVCLIWSRLMTDTEQPQTECLAEPKERKGTKQRTRSIFNPHFSSLSARNCFNRLPTPLLQAESQGFSFQRQRLKLFSVMRLISFLLWELFLWEQRAQWEISTSFKYFLNLLSPGKALKSELQSSYRNTNPTPSERTPLAAAPFLLHLQ